MQHDTSQQPVRWATQTFTCAFDTDLCSDLPVHNHSLDHNHSLEEKNLACTTRADVQERAECQTARLNQVGKLRTCFRNPTNSTEVQIQGTQASCWGLCVDSITFWAVLTLFLALARIDSVSDQPRDAPLRISVVTPPTASTRWSTQPNRALFAAFRSQP